MGTASGDAQVYAGFWPRVAAVMVDQAILMICNGIITVAAVLAGSMAFAVSQVVTLLITLLYWPVMESSARQATFGKQLMGLQVVTLDGERTSFVRALGRNLAKIISSIPLGIGFLMPAFTARKQALHDMIARCVVVQTGPSHFVKGLAAAVGGLAVASVLMYFVTTEYVMPEMAKGMSTALNDAMQADMKKMQAAASAPKPLPTTVPASVTPPPSTAAAAPAAASSPAPGAAPATATAPAAAPAATPAPAPAGATVLAQAAPKGGPAKPAAEAARKESTPAPEKAAPAMAEAPEAAPRPAARPRPAEPRRPLAAASPPPAPPGPAPRVFAPKYNDVMTAVMQRDPAAVTELLDIGMNVDQPSSNGMTPLMGAVVVRDPKLVQMLLSRGADPNARGPGGLTPLSLAQDRQDGVLVGLLQKAGAR